MTRRRLRSCLAGMSALLVAAPCAPAGGGPDIVVSRVGETSQMIPNPDYAAYGAVGGVAAFSVGTTACNVGEGPAEWMWGESGRHPVIAQNLYRLHGGRFEQIGMSWLKHSFCAGSEPTCGTCAVSGCDTLGVGCADTYWATLNGDWLGLGPRSQVDPQAWGEPTHVGEPPDPVGPDVIRGRLQVRTGDLGWPGARYVVEAHYVTHDEAPPDRLNNASWREVDVSVSAMAHAGPLHEGDPAIFAWAALDADVSLAGADVPGEGRFWLGWRVEALADGTWQYEYALFNLNSDRGAGSFSVPVPDAVDVWDAAFHDVEYHSGEVYAGTDWPAQRGSGAVAWSTSGFAVDPNANALRWSSLYNFGFRAAAPPAPGAVTVGLFKPGVPSSIAIDPVAPGIWDVTCPEDVDASGTVDVGDLAAVIDAWGGKGRGDVTGDGRVDVGDLVAVIMAWGGCGRG